MSAGVVSCTICSENYKSNEEILSTICGHVFHQSCWQDWQTRSQTCPQCRLDAPSTHRIFLHIEDPSPSQTNLSEQNTELENKISLLECQLEESERIFLDSETELHRLEIKINELNLEIDCQRAQNESKDQENRNLQEELENCEKNISYLLEKTNQKDEQLRKQFEEKELEFSNLRSENNNSEKNIFDLLEQTKQKDEEIKKQCTKIDFLKLQNQSRLDEITRLKNENEENQSKLVENQRLHLMLENKLKISDQQIIKLNTDIKNLKDLAKQCTDEKEIGSEKMKSEKIMSNIPLEEKVNVLREKLKQMSLQLEKEIMQATNLSVENMKLRSLLSLSRDDKQKMVDQMEGKQCKSMDGKIETS